MDRRRTRFLTERMKLLRFAVGNNASCVARSGGHIRPLSAPVCVCRPNGASCQQAELHTLLGDMPTRRKR